MEVSAPVETLQVFTSGTGSAWSKSPVSSGMVRSIAENVIALVVWPRLPAQDDAAGTKLSTDYSYDSRTADAWTGTPPKQPVQAHQLPPNLQITMVVIDEDSAKRIESEPESTPPAAIDSALEGLFDESVTKYASDLKELQDRLNDAKIGYRIFTTTVLLRESKWSP